MFEYRNIYPVTDENQRCVGIPNSHRIRISCLPMRVCRGFKLRDKYSVRFSVSGFSLTNYFNPEAIHWNTADPAHSLFLGERHRRFTAKFDVLFGNGLADTSRSA